MKTLYHDGGKLVPEIRSGSLSLEWIKFITLTFVWLLICGGIIAQTRSIRCTKVAPKWTNCQVADTLFWGAMRNVRNANGVQQVVLDEAIGHSDASQYPIYQVSFVLRYSHFGLKCDTNLRNNYESLHQWWCQGERTSSIFLMR
jgi:hypothetical protein